MSRLLSKSRPTNRRLRPTRDLGEVWSDGLDRAGRTALRHLPEPVRRYLPRPTLVRRVLRACAIAALLVWAAIASFGLHHAAARPNDHTMLQTELRGVLERRDAERARSEALQAELTALQTRADVRVDAIRRELQMLGKSERVYLLR